MTMGLKCRFYNDSVDSSNIHNLHLGFKWNKQSEFVYKTKLSSDEIGLKIKHILNESNDFDIDDFTENVNDVLLSAAHSTLVQKRGLNAKKSVKKKKAWFDQDCYKLRKEVIKLGRKLCKVNSTHEQRQVFFRKKRELKKLAKHKKQLFKQFILDQLNDLSDGNPKQYWQLVKSLKDLENQSSSNGSPITPEEWIKHFKELLCTNNNRNKSELETLIKEMSSKPTFNNLDYRITKQEIKSAIAGLKNGKACGLDTISAEMVKTSLPILLDVYVKLFNTIFSNGLYPKCWRDSYIVPLFKSGSRSDPSNYRGISINSILGKVFSIVLKNRLEQFVQENTLIDDTQIGFKRNCRTSDHMFVLRTLIDKYVKKLKTPLYVCFVDFKKAYDSVWRQALMYKLLANNVRGVFFNMLQSMYLDNSICIKLNNHERSNFFESNTGVRQGDALSPLLFNLYTADLQKFLQIECNSPSFDKTYVNCLMYADDLLLMSQTEDGLQRLLDRLGEYCDKWGMEVNIEKTKVMKFSGNGHKCKRHFMYKTKTIENVMKYKYLGIEFSSSGTWNHAISNLSDRGMKALYLLKRYISIGNIKPKLGLKLFDQMIKPILCYCSEVWIAADLTKRNFNQSNGVAKFLENLDIEKVHVRFIKFILGVNKKAVNLAVKGELGRFPIGISCLLQALKYWDHLQSSENTLLREALSLSTTLNNEGVFSWVTFVKSLFKMINIDVEHISQEAVVLLRNKLCDLYIKYWINGIDSFSKMDSYRSFKSNFIQEDYFNDITNRAHRASYTKIRISNHRLAIERGRYYKIPRNERYCEFCKRHQILQVEDEIHVLLTCLKHKAPRTDLFEVIKSNCSNFEKLHSKEQFNYLMNSSGPIVRAVAKFCHLVQNA